MIPLSPSPSLLPLVMMLLLQLVHLLRRLPLISQQQQHPFALMIGWSSMKMSVITSLQQQQQQHQVIVAGHAYTIAPIAHTQAIGPITWKSTFLPMTHIAQRISLVLFVANALHANTTWSVIQNRPITSMRISDRSYNYYNNMAFAFIFLYIFIYLDQPFIRLTPPSYYVNIN